MPHWQAHRFFMSRLALWPLAARAAERAVLPVPAAALASSQHCRQTSCQRQQLYRPKMPLQNPLLSGRKCWLEQHPPAPSCRPNPTTLPSCRTNVLPMCMISYRHIPSRRHRLWNTRCPCPCRKELLASHGRPHSTARSNVHSTVRCQEWEGEVLQGPGWGGIVKGRGNRGEK